MDPFSEKRVVLGAILAAKTHLSYKNVNALPIVPESFMSDARGCLDLWDSLSFWLCLLRVVRKDVVCFCHPLRETIP